MRAASLGSDGRAREAPADPGLLLAIDSSTALSSVAVGSAEGLLSEITWRSGARGSATLLPAVDEALRRAAIEPGDLSGVVVSGGPGSFTGVRTAAATAKGIVHALEVPLYSYSGLLATAAQAAFHDGPVCALFDARGRDLYAACYSFTPDVRTLFPPAALAVEELIERLRGMKALRLVGDGADKHREELERHLAGRVSTSLLTTTRAAALLWLASETPELGRVQDPGLWEPDYVRASGAERIAAARASGGTST